MPNMGPLLTPWRGSPEEFVSRLLYALLIAFIVGQLNAWCYMWTHRGLSYTRTFTQALVLICVISALSMSIVATNILAAFGLLGGLAIIRFRTVVRDSRDTAYVLLCLICGMAAGFGFYAAAVIGSVAAGAVSLYLHRTGFGAWRSLDSLLRLQVDRASLESPAWDELLRRFCRRYSVISMDDIRPLREGDQALCQCSYRVQLRDPEEAGSFIAALKAMFVVSTVNLLVQQENEEIS